MSIDARAKATAAGALGGKRRLGVFSVAFMIIAASAPLTVMAGGVTTTFAVTGVIGIPLSFLLLGAVLALFAVGYAAMSRHVSNAGALYAYIAQGLGRPFGVGASFVALMAYNLMQVGIYGLFGFTAASLIGSRLGISVPWWLAALVCIAVVACLGVNRVDLSAKVLGACSTGVPGRDRLRRGVARSRSRRHYCGGVRPGSLVRSRRGP